MSTDQEDETAAPGPGVDDQEPEPEAELEEWLEHLQTRADSSADVGSRAFAVVLALVLGLLGLLALIALVSRLMAS